jgi:hypothetical protein
VASTSQPVSVQSGSYDVGSGARIGAAAAENRQNAEQRAVDLQLSKQQLRRATAEADIVTQQAAAAQRSLAAQPANPPLFETVPNRVTAHVLDNAAATAGVSPTRSTVMLEDAWTGQPRPASIPAPEYGGAIENMGELWQFLLSTPYALDNLRKKYLATPSDYLSDRMLDAHQALDKAARRVPNPYRR